MIVVNNRWVIQVDEWNYTVCQNKPRQNTRKDGKVETRYPIKSYHRTLSDALQAICDEEVRISLTDDTKTLAEAIADVRRVRNEVRKMIEELLEDDGK